MKWTVSTITSSSWSVRGNEHEVNDQRKCLDELHGDGVNDGNLSTVLFSKSDNKAKNGEAEPVSGS